MPYDGDVHMLFWNKVAFERPDNKKKFKDKYKYDLLPPKTWKQWDDAAEFFHGWGWDGTDNKLFGAGASYKPSGSGYSYHWWRSRFFSYGGQYFDADMKPLINSAPALRALEEMVRTMPYYPPGVLLFESEEPKTMLVKGEIPLLLSWTSTGKRVGDARESVIVGKAGFGLVPGAEIDGKIVHRPAITPGPGHGGVQVLQEDRADHEGPGVHLAPGPEPEDRDGPQDDHGSRGGSRTSAPRSSARPSRARPSTWTPSRRPSRWWCRIRSSPAPTSTSASSRSRSPRRWPSASRPRKRSTRPPREWDKITDRRGRDKQKAAWGEKMAEMKAIGIEYHPDWAAKAK